MGRRPNLTPAQKDRIDELRERGTKVRVIAAELGVSPGAVSWHLLASGTEPPKGNRIFRPPATPRAVMRNGHPVRSFTSDEDGRLMALDHKGLTPSEIGRELGRLPNSIIGRLRTLARHQAKDEG